MASDFGFIAKYYEIVVSDAVDSKWVNRYRVLFAGSPHHVCPEQHNLARRVLDFGRSARQSTMLIDILAQEVKQGFEGGAWTDAVERESIRSYIVSLLSSYARICDRFASGKDLDSMSTITKGVHDDLDILADLFRNQYPEISLVADGLADMFKRSADKPSELAAWCRSAQLMYPRNQHPWK